MNRHTFCCPAFPSILSAILLSLFTFGCGSKSGPSDPAFLVKDVDPKQVATILHYHSEQIIVLDVRTPKEFKSGHIEGAVNHDYNNEDFAERLASLDLAKDVVLHCASGGRSAGALDALETAGANKIYHLSGGMNAWRAAGMPIKK